MKMERKVTNEAGNKFDLTIECDLSKLTKEQIEQYALDSIWIKEQATLRAMSNSAFELMKGSYKFKASPKGIRKAAVISNEKIVATARDKMSKEERLELIKKLEALDKKFAEKHEEKKGTLIK